MQRPTARFAAQHAEIERLAAELGASSIRAPSRPIPRPRRLRARIAREDAELYPIADRLG